MKTEVGVSSYLVVIYGAAAESRDTAWQLARTLPGKSAVLSVDGLLEGAIASSDDDGVAELDMAYTQLRLLTANYMRNGYHVVVEGTFFHERDGQTHRHEQDIDQLVALMRNMTRKALMVHLRPSGEGPGFEYRQRYGGNALSLDAGGGPAAAAEAVRDKLLAEESG
jgi:hypothetical protein